MTTTTPLRWRCLGCNVTRPTTPRDGGDADDVLWWPYGGGFHHKCKSGANKHEAVLELVTQDIVVTVDGAPVDGAQVTVIADTTPPAPVALGKIGLAPRIVKVLADSNAKTLSDLTAWTEKDLGRLHGVGVGAVATIKRAMAQYGMELAK